ncbi:MAG: alkaline phosphatase [Pyramidobacter sp.]|nr:alkaline phosphatase [Pyramidobacter sp.]
MSVSTLKKHFSRFLNGLCVVLAAASIAQAADAKYVFLLIGDGMAMTQRSAAEIYQANRESAKGTPSVTHLAMNSLPAQGMSTTYAADSYIPDSASAGTAIATGNKTRDGMIAMDTTGAVPFKSIATLAHEKGMKVGIVSSVSIEHATPAVFYANEPSRKNYYEISLQIPRSNFDYFAGGGFLKPNGKKGDQKSIYDVLKDSGYTVTTTKAAFDALKAGSDTKVVSVNPVLDASQALPYDLDEKDAAQGISLADFTAKGIELLDNPNGFFMMVEGGKIDWTCHANDALASIRDTLAFDDAVKVALDFYKKHPEETLVIVTADHETGGLTIGFAGTQYTTNFNVLSSQKMSYDVFDQTIAQWRKQQLPFEEAMKTVTECFGLSTDPKAGVLALADYEIAELKAAYAESMKEADQRTDAKKAEYYLQFGGYEPFSISVTQTLNRHAGIGWTTYAHTGVPVPVSAIGFGHEAFNGYYDDCDIFTKMRTAMGL